MKTIFAAIVLILIAGCTNSAREIHFSVTPQELSDCKFYELENTSGKHITVVRCPVSDTSTTYKAGKAMVGSAVIEERSQ